MAKVKLSVIIPCFNERDTIEEILEKVENVSLDVEKEIVIIDDCSSDGTREFLTQQIETNPQYKIVLHGTNQGKGASLRSGFKEATGDILIIQDADLEYDPDDYHKVLAPILSGKADVVFGSRFIGGESHRVLYFWHSLGNKFLTMLSNACTNLNLTDMEVCYKAFKREIIQQIEIKENRFGFEPEFTAKVARLNCRIYEVGVSYYGRTYAEGKKINWKDGCRALYVILKYAFLKQ